MVKSVPYIRVKNGKNAIKLYESIFNAKLMEHQPFSRDMGSQFGFPENFDYKNSTMHAKLDIGGERRGLENN